MHFALLDPSLDSYDSQSYLLINMFLTIFTNICEYTHITTLATSLAIEEPRYVLNKITKDFREMTPNKAEALCCGGSGGLVALAEYADRRITAGKPKADQIKKTGARAVVAACENCRLQIGDLNEHYNLNVQITALTDLVVRAM